MKDETKLNNNRKPLTERKRRARINASLEALKNILEACDPETISTTCRRNVKLEKADILELTVKYLQKVTMQKRAYVHHPIHYHPVTGYFQQGVQTVPQGYPYIYPGANERMISVEPPRKRMRHTVAVLPPSPLEEDKVSNYSHSSSSVINEHRDNELVLPPSPPQEEPVSCWRPW